MSDVHFAAADGGAKPRIAKGFVLSVVFASIGSAVADAVIALVARSVGASQSFQPLTPIAYIPLTVVGVLIGAIGWQVVLSRVDEPAKTLWWLVPVAVLLSFIPDVTLGVSRFIPGASWGAVAALMLMHLAVATISVSAFSRLMPAR